MPAALQRGVPHIISHNKAILWACGIALVALLCMQGGQNQLDRTPREVDVTPLMHRLQKSMRGYQNRTNLASPAALVIQAAKNPILKTQLNNAGVVEVLTSILRKNRQDSSLYLDEFVGESLRALALMCHEQEVQQLRVLNYGLLPSLMDLLHDEGVSSSGGVVELLHVLLPHHQEVRTELVADEGKHVKGVIRVMEAGLTHGVPSTMLVGTYLLLELMKGVGDGKLLSSCGATDIWVKAVQSTMSVPLRASSLMGLYQMMTNMEEEDRAIMADDLMAKGIPLSLVKEMQSSPDEVIRPALLLTSQLLGSDPAKHLFMEQGLMSATVSIWFNTTHHTGVRAGAAGVLMKLAGTRMEGSTAPENKHVLAALAALIRQTQASPAVEHTLKAVHAMVRFPDGSAAAHRHGMIAVLVDLIRGGGAKQGGDQVLVSSVRHWVSLTLALLSKQKEHRAEVVQQGAVGLMVDFLREYRGASGPQQQAKLAATAALVAIGQDKAYRTSIIYMGALQPLLEMHQSTIREEKDLASSLLRLLSSDGQVADELLRAKVVL